MASKKLVCLDPGHDPGNRSNASPDKRYYEYEFAWDMALRVKELLEAQSVKVVLTKNQKERKGLTERANVSNTVGADLFVSLHTNAAGRGWSDPRGLELFTAAPGATAGRNLAAACLLRRFGEAGVLLRPSPLRHQDFTVLTRTKAPAVLIEYGFHSNREDVTLLQSDHYREKLSLETAKGICDFLFVPFQSVEKPKDPNRERVQRRFGLADATMDYLERYQYGADLLQKLATKE